MDKLANAEVLGLTPSTPTIFTFDGDPKTDRLSPRLVVVFRRPYPFNWPI